MSVETAARTLRDFAITFLLQWGHARMSVETPGMSYYYDRGTDASMGPRSDERGNTVTGYSYSTAKTLQWGHARMSVETAVHAEVMVERDLLQWGHARMSVETDQLSLGVCEIPPRFNGATLG